MDAKDAGPSDDSSYGRVTHAERFQVLHDGARQLIDDLVRDFFVTRSAPDEVGPGTRYTGGVLEVVTLTPERSDQGALTVTFTGFPGLDVQFGRWNHELYPWCGCDMCDDDPAQLLEELNSTVHDLIAGNVVEELKRGGELSFRTPSRGRGTTLDRAQAKAAGPAARHAWAAWTPRRSDAEASLEGPT